MGRQAVIIFGTAFALCARAEAGAAKASFAVSVTVADQCLVQPVSRMANCSGGARYAVAVSKEVLTPVSADQLTYDSDQAHITRDGRANFTSSHATGDAAIRSETVALGNTHPSGTIEAVRVTYSF